MLPNHLVPLRLQRRHGHVHARIGSPIGFRSSRPGDLVGRRSRHAARQRNGQVGGAPSPDARRHGRRPRPVRGLHLAEQPPVAQGSQQPPGRADQGVRPGRARSVRTGRSARAGRPRLRADGADPQHREHRHQ